ncbi:MlaA family lipoprotein [Syntrophus aciditrophicus]|uniref:Surface lipoprotein n=1 Tax=Syntrophus aciditrophicus (strain SB) TaxID=56780 RepID=Q2LQ50_SYNAS|nr:VacJ family lipoprotein [Syntrophus aciditrophicus]ABC76141.1 surface lipoprotein [Syntrophus aciditrophicus SB]
MKKLRLSVFFLLVLSIVAGSADRSDASIFPAGTVAPLQQGIAGESIHEAPVVRGLPEMSATPGPMHVQGMQICAAAAVRTEEKAEGDEEAGNVSDPMESLNAPEAEGAEETDVSDDLESDYLPEEGEEQPTVTISDPLEPFNRAMYHFNDKLYFWLLKPVGQAYGKVVPEPARISVRNFFSNLAFPFRFLSCLLQADFRGVATETGRFTVNTIWGIGGFLDASSSRELNIPKQDVDLGQTLGVYGVGHGFYFVWPVFGPSSLRDSADIVGGFFLDPVNYLNPWYTPAAVHGYEAVNETSLTIGDYEALKGAAIDPYVSIRDAFVQYRKKKIDARKVKMEHSGSVETQKK